MCSLIQAYRRFHISCKVVSNYLWLKLVIISHCYILILYIMKTIIKFNNITIIEIVENQCLKLFKNKIIVSESFIYTFVILLNMPELARTFL